MAPELKAMIEAARRRPMTAEELEAQEISFAFGNVAYEDQRVTRATVVRCSEAMKGVDESPKAATPG